MNSKIDVMRGLMPYGRILMHYQNKSIHFQKGNPRIPQAVLIYARNASLLNWIDRYLERRAKDTERRRDTSTMSNSGKGD
jgi:hypothetical protein